MKKRDLSAVFIELKCGWLQACLTDMKNHKTLEMLLRADFLSIFKILHFSRFFKSSVAHAKIVEIVFLAEHGEQDRFILRR